MYSNTAYLNPKETDLEDLTLPLRINSCGHYRYITIDSHKTTRPHGREDYQIIYIASGKAYLQCDKQQIEVPAGHMLLYLPGQPQYYWYRQIDETEVYWIHFTGYDVMNLLSNCGWPVASPMQAENPLVADNSATADKPMQPKSSTPHVFCCGILPEFQSIFHQLIRELQVFRPGYDQLMNLLFQQFLWLAWRNQQEAALKHKRLRMEIEQAVHYFHENLASPILIDDYAQSCHMSTCWFIRSFKQQMGMPPLQYLTSIRINRAKELLKDTENTISEISLMVGFDNPLYFSKLFKKQTGQSPTAYRKATWK